MATFADHIIRYNNELHFSGKLPDGFRVLNPFRDNAEVVSVSNAFYNKYYGDNNRRKFIIGINPGRFGAGVTGIPFTDSKRLEEICGIQIASVTSHEVSSVFIYDVINAYGGARQFYNKFYINSIFPLALIRENDKGNWVNCNYYDDKKLFEALYDDIVSNLKRQIGFGLDTGKCIVLGKKNLKFFEIINKEERLFDTYTMLEHPRYIEQYKLRDRDKYIEKYITTLQAT